MAKVAMRKTSRLTLQEHALLLLLLGLLVLGSIVRYHRYRSKPVATQPPATELSRSAAGQKMNSTITHAED